MTRLSKILTDDAKTTEVTKPKNIPRNINQAYVFNMFLNKLENRL